MLLRRVRSLFRPNQVAQLPLATASLRRSAFVVSARNRRATVLLDTKRNEYFTLTDVGTDIWDLLAVQTTGKSIVDGLAAEYDAPHDQIAADVLGLLDQLIAKGIVERAAPERL